MNVAHMADFRSGEPEEKGNDRPDKGEFLRFHTRLLETLAWETYLTPIQVRIILHVARMTWGWNRKFFLFKQSEVADRLGIDKGNLSRAFNALIQADVLITNKGEVGINKYIEQWNHEHLGGTKRSAVGKKPSCEKTNKKLAKNQHEVGDLTTSTSPEPAPPADSNAPYRHIFIDKPINIPPIVPQGTEVKETSMTSKYDPLYRFDDWYNHYPVKQDRGAAERAWKKLTKLKDFNDEFVDRLIAAVEHHKQVDPRWKDGFIKYPATWLNAKAWLNEYSATKPMAANGGPAKRQSVDDVLDAWMRGDGG